MPLQGSGQISMRDIKDEFGPNPGNLDIAFINSSISLVSIMIYKGHLKPGIPKPPVTLESSSDVLDLRLLFALL